MGDQHDKCGLTGASERRLKVVVQSNDRIVGKIDGYQGLHVPNKIGKLSLHGQSNE